MKLSLFVIAALLTSVALISCNKNPIPPEQQPQLNLTLEDVSCTEAWLKLTTSNISLPADVELLKDGIHSETISLTSADTILYIDSLLPNKTYNLTSFIQSNNQSINASVPVSTMDTTSHNFTWQTWTFGGDAGSCNFYDVAVINENDIWAVGQVNIADTSINGYTTYNAAHWNGLEWEMWRLQFYTFCGETSTGSYPARSIIAFSSNDLWITSGSQITHFDGVNQLSIECIPVSVNKLWGSNDNDLYVVGQIGKIAHYQNTQWTKIESGTDMSLVDMVGTEGNNIFMCGGDGNNLTGIILKKNDPGWGTIANSKIVTREEIFKPDLFGSISAIWLDDKNTLYAAGNLLYQYKFGRWDYVHSLPENFIGGNPNVYYRGYIGDVKGLKSNDMWIVGDRNTLRHFNGVSWKQIGFPYSPDSDIVWYTVYPAANCTAVVGFKGNSAIVMLITK